MGKDNRQIERDKREANDKESKRIPKKGFINIRDIEPCDNAMIVIAGAE